MSRIVQCGWRRTVERLWHGLPARGERSSRIELRNSVLARFSAWAGSPCHRRVLGLVVFAASLGARSAGYFEDFEKTPIGKLPDSINVLDGDFSIRDVDGNRCLELAGDPIGGFGALIGPGGLTSCDISARIWAAPSGKRFPEFGIGANDAGGPKLFVTPGTGSIELRWGDSAIATSSFSWKPSAWTFVRLQLESRQGKWTAHGKAWNAGESEPAKWMVEAPLPKAPNPGRASVWGSDYSEKPIRFDDVHVNVPV